MWARERQPEQPDRPAPLGWLNYNMEQNISQALFSKKMKRFLKPKKPTEVPPHEQDLSFQLLPFIFQNT